MKKKKKLNIIHSNLSFSLRLAGEQLMKWKCVYIWSWAVYLLTELLLSMEYRMSADL